MINRQQHERTCGPVALANAAQHLGMKMSYKDVLKFAKECIDYDISHGTWDYQMKAGLITLGIEYGYRKCMTLKEIEGELDKGNSIILAYRWYYKGDNGGHYVFINGHTDKYITAWNSSRKNKTARITKKRLSEYIWYSNRHHRDYYTRGIIIKGMK